MTVKRVSRKYEIVWYNSLFLALLHLVSIFGCIYAPYPIKLMTFLWACLLFSIAAEGTSAGAHRLWSHRSYKATLPLRIILMLCYCVSGQYNLLYWVRDHRVHHKYSDTDADPHNAARGFFFSHIGWLMVKRLPENVEKGKKINLTDFFEDPVIQFHLRYFTWLRLVLCYILPVVIPVLCWNEGWYWAFMGPVVCRLCYSLNVLWLINSAAHMWGNKPYDKNIRPSENSLVSFLSLGEGWHNYHHTFPMDYRSAEFGTASITTLLIDALAKIGWAYDLKTPSDEIVRNTILNKGDGSWYSKQTNKQT